MWMRRGRGRGAYWCEYSCHGEEGGNWLVRQASAHMVKTGFLPLGRFTGNRRQLRAREGFTVDRNAPNYGHSTRIYPCALILLQYDLKITISCTHYNRRRILCIALAFQGVIVVKLHSYSTNIWVLACKTGTKPVGPTGVSARWLRKW